MLTRLTQIILSRIKTKKNDMFKLDSLLCE